MKLKSPTSFFIALAIVMIALVIRAATLTQVPVYSGSVTPLLIQTGTGCTAALAYSSNSFPLAYSALPTVLVTQVGVTNSPTNNIFVTNTYFLLTNGGVNISNNWVAIGAP